MLKVNVNTDINNTSLNLRDPLPQQNETIRMM